MPSKPTSCTKERPDSNYSNKQLRNSNIRHTLTESSLFGFSDDWKCEECEMFL